jgi:hypothetical protein
MTRLVLLLLVLAAACRPATAPRECAGTIDKGGQYHADTLTLRCR